MDRPLRVLLVEDNPGDAWLVTEALEDAARVELAVQLTVQHVVSLAAAIEALDPDAAPFDVVLLDLGLPDVGTGIDALRRLLAHAPDTSVIVLTGLDDSSTAARAVAHGAQDYLVKSSDPDGGALLQAVRFARQRSDRLAALRAANDELGAFAHTIAHDLRSPLAAIVGLAQLLTGDQGDLADDDRTEIATGIQDAGRRLSRMVTGLLAYAEQAGAEREPVALRDVVDWVLGLVQHDLKDAGGTVSVGPLGTVLADEPGLRTVLLNLVSNAIKYRDDQRPLELRIGAVEQHGRTIVTVGDNGRGIDPADRSRVFALGERGVATEHAHGVGIGLSSVRRILAQLDGAVWIEDGEGGTGTRLRFSLTTADEPGRTIPSGGSATRPTDATPVVVVDRSATRAD